MARKKPSDFQSPTREQLAEMGFTTLVNSWQETSYYTMHIPIHLCRIGEKHRTLCGIAFDGGWHRMDVGKSGVSCGSCDRAAAKMWRERQAVDLMAPPPQEESQ